MLKCAPEVRGASSPWSHPKLAVVISRVNIPATSLNEICNSAVTVLSDAPVPGN